MILTVGGLPHQADPTIIEYRWTLEQLIWAYLDTRQWKRNKRADELEVVWFTGQVALQTTSFGSKKAIDDYERWLKMLRLDIDTLRDPEIQTDFIKIPLSAARWLYGQDTLDQLKESGEYEVLIDDA